MRPPIRPDGRFHIQHPEEMGTRQLQKIDVGLHIGAKVATVLVPPGRQVGSFDDAFSTG